MPPEAKPALSLRRFPVSSALMSPMMKGKRAGQRAEVGEAKEKARTLCPVILAAASKEAMSAVWKG